MKKSVAALPGASARQVHVTSIGSRHIASTGGANKTCGHVATKLECLVGRKEYECAVAPVSPIVRLRPPLVPVGAVARWPLLANTVISTGLAITKEV